MKIISGTFCAGGDNHPPYHQQMPGLSPRKITGPPSSSSVTNAPDTMLFIAIFGALDDGWYIIQDISAAEELNVQQTPGMVKEQSPG